MYKQVYSAIALSLLVTACATTPTSSSSTVQTSPTVTQQVGRIVEKETVVTQTQAERDRAVDLGVGIGSGGHVGVGLGVNIGTLFGWGRPTTVKTDYKYKIKLSETESIVLLSNQDHPVGACLTVNQRANDSHYPQIQANLTCKLN